MSSTYDILALTDHSRHSRHNSAYGLLRAIASDSRAGRVEAASRGDGRNNAFFDRHQSEKLYCLPVNEQFVYAERDSIFESERGRWASLSDFDILVLRLPRPIENGFFSFLTDNFPDEQIVNRPSGIIETSSKTFLLNFPELCPPIKLCKTAEEIHAFSRQFPVVLKPLESYGGEGLIKIDGSTYSDGDQEKPLEDLMDKLRRQPVPYLAMKFLKNVDQGDKRILVSNGRILGASLRLPPEGSWLCNVAQGGSAKPAEPDERERRIAEIISPILLEKGIVLFGFDTLVDDMGNRVLSEINTLSIGGITPAQQASGRPIEKMAADGFWEYITERL